jgi:iron complex outermembrane receptor protein
MGTDYVRKGKTICSFYLVVTNVFNVAYQSHLNRLKYTAENTATSRTGIFNMGRNVSFKLNIPLSTVWK